MSALRKQMEADMVVRNFSVRTRESYIASVRGLAKYFKRSPDTLTEDEVQRYLLHLIEERKLAWSSVNVTVSALKFLFPRDTEAQRAPSSPFPARISRRSCRRSSPAKR